jgi:hypothetical protein
MRGLPFVRRRSVIGRVPDRPRSPILASARSDFAGNSAAELALFRPSTGRWHVRGRESVKFGEVGDIPVPADYDGDGAAELAFFRPSTGRWHIRGRESVKFGEAGDIPVPADYDGDGAAELAFFRPSTGRWYVQNQPSVAFGQQGDVPLALPWAISDALPDQT